MKSSQQVSDYSHGVCAVTVPVGMPCQTSQYCSSEVPHPVMTDDYLTLPVACIATFNTIKASQKRQSFCFSTILIVSCSESLMWCLQQQSRTVKL